MKKIALSWLACINLLFYWLFIASPCFADDTCMFAVTADDLEPNIVILLDNGAELEYITWHPDYVDSIDYTPDVDEADREDVVEDGTGGGNGFFNANGYSIDSHGGSYYLVPILDNLEKGSYTDGLQANSGNTWTINGRSVILPVEPSSVSVDGVIDNAANFRYSKNYLNWIFFWDIDGVLKLENISGNFQDDDALTGTSGGAASVDGSLDGDLLEYDEKTADFTVGEVITGGTSGATATVVAAAEKYTGDGSNLPDRTRFYYAKKAVMTVAKLASNKAQFGIYNFSSTSQGASRVQPLGMVVDTLVSPPENNILEPNFVNNVNNMGTVTYSPLAEGLAAAGGYYASPSSGVVGEYCQKNFVVVLSPGISSEDAGVTSTQYQPNSLSDIDGDDAGGEIGEGNIKEDANTYTIPTNLNGSTYLDDVAYYLYANDIVDYQDGFQNVLTYTIGFMGDTISNLFLINTSNNGNGNKNLYDTTDSEYGKYHFEAENPEDLSSALMAALTNILSATSTFTAPVVPVTRTTSGSRMYMALFKPGENNFWEGNVVKFGISNTNVIIDSGGNAATWPNGAIKEDATPYWETKNWADPTKTNYIHNTNRSIYTYLGVSTNLVDSSNAFSVNNSDLTAAVLGNPTHSTDQIIGYVRGADVFDEDGDGDTSGNRSIITGDVLHSEPCVVDYNASTSVIYFGANDGMLHAVSDASGSELWGFILPNQLSGLKDMIEGANHQYYMDSSPKIYIKDTDGDGDIESGDGDRVILVCGERSGGTGYFALDVTDPAIPIFLWRINRVDDSAAGPVPAGAAPDVVIADLGLSFSEPQFARVKTSDADATGTPVFFIGGGYSSTNAVGKAVIAIDILTGAVVKTFNADMNYSFPSAVTVVDADSNGFVDKIYIGDLGGQMWRFGKFTDGAGSPLAFPDADENISNWTGEILFQAPDYVVDSTTYKRKFFYPPAVTLERGYDLIFMGTGDRQDSCRTNSSDVIYCVKDTHTAPAILGDPVLGLPDLVNVSDTAATPPKLDSSTGDVDGNLETDQGWYIQLAAGEKILSEGFVYCKTYYITTFMPNTDPCLPGGAGKLYALSYKTGEAALDFDQDGDKERSLPIGGGIPSKPVMVITKVIDGEKLFISVGSTNPDDNSEAINAGVLAVDPYSPFSGANFVYVWWKES